MDIHTYNIPIVTPVRHNNNVHLANTGMIGPTKLVADAPLPHSLHIYNLNRHQGVNVPSSGTDCIVYRSKDISEANR